MRVDRVRRIVMYSSMMVSYLSLGCAVDSRLEVEGNRADLDSARRYTMDRPDDTNLPQIHLLYALPSDGRDRNLDTNGLIRSSVLSAQEWLRGESGGSRLRFDTHRGELDVTFVRLPRSDSEYFAFGNNARDQIEYDLWSAGFTAANKIYAAYYGGRLQKCGSGPQPPATPGKVVVLAPLTPTCPEPFPAPAPPLDWEYTLIHEIFHALGAVGEQAPGQIGGHVTDSRKDLMSAGEWEFPSILDINRNHYWGHSETTFPDLSKSAFLDPTPAHSVLPAVWPLQAAVVVPVSQESTLRSPSTTLNVGLQIVNQSRRDLHLHWIDDAGTRNLHQPVPPDGDPTFDTHAGHFWVLADDTGTALAIYQAPDQGWARAIYSSP